MKRILSITVALLLLMLALAGCGGGSEEPAEAESAEVSETAETETADTEETETAETAEETSSEEAAETDAVAAGSDLMALVNKMVDEAGISDTVAVSAEALTNVYGLDPAVIVAAAGYNASSGGAFPQEIIVVQARDAAAADVVAQAFTNRLNDIAAQAESYDPTSLDLAKKCTVVTNGDFVGLFFSEHYDTLVDLFQKGL